MRACRVLIVLHVFSERQIQGALSPSIRRIPTTCAKIKFYCVIAIAPKMSP
jgi:hypothetical protein